MIRLPRRSVTRFFIPLIDVLTLLFCIYLLMPIVKNVDDASATNVSGELTAAERAELDKLRRQARQAPGKLTEEEERELERLRREKIETLQQRLAIRVLEIDADTGKLFYYNPDRTEITSAAEARRLIDRQQREAPGREIYYLFLFPRKVTGFPEERQVREYESWFKDVPHGIDNPRAAQ